MKRTNSITAGTFPLLLILVWAGNALLDVVLMAIDALVDFLDNTIPVTVDALFRVALVGMAAWYWITTWVPIGAESVYFWILKTIPVALRAMRSMGRAAASVAFSAAGWVLVILLVILAASKTTGKTTGRAISAGGQTMAASWAWRAELIREAKA